MAVASSIDTHFSLVKTFIGALHHARRERLREMNKLPSLRSRERSSCEGSGGKPPRHVGGRGGAAKSGEPAVGSLFSMGFQEF